MRSDGRCDEAAANQTQRQRIVSRWCIEERRGDALLLQAWVKVFDGYWQARRGEVNGLTQLRQGIAEWTAAGSRGGYVYQRLLLIEVCLAAGDHNEVQRAAAEAQAFIEQSGYRVYEAELHRLRGELAMERAVRPNVRPAGL